MPISFDMPAEGVATLDEVMDHFSSIDISDRDQLLAGSKVLRALANNRGFLATRIAQELRNVVNLQEDNQYSAQVFFLGRGRNFFVRANFWPAADDPILRASGPRSFFYGVPHDHNFDFLTVGYHGPGYVSDFYEYEFDKVAGYIGEKLDLRFVRREALPEGRVMLYRASVDIHEQLPPESFSISLNVVSDFKEQIATVNQYMVDLSDHTIESLGNRTSLPLICEVAGEIGDDECRELVAALCERHPYPRGRYSAYAALARLCPADGERIWEKAAADGAPFVHVQAKMRLDEMARDAQPGVRAA